MNQILDINRLVMYSRLKINLNKKMLIISLTGFLGFVFIITFFIANNIQPGMEEMMNNFHLGAYLAMLFLGVVFIAGRSLNDMNSSEKSISQIMIPSSNFEKFVVPLISSSILWIVVSLISYELFALVINLLWSGVFNISLGYFNVFNFGSEKVVGEILKSFFLIHSIFFLGAAAFKKYPIGKTALSTFIFNSFFTFLSLFLILIIFGSFTEFGLVTKSVVEETFYNGKLTMELLKNIKDVAEIVFILVIPIILYTAAYFKLKEREV